MGLFDDIFGSTSTQKSRSQAEPYQRYEGLIQGMQPTLKRAYRDPFTFFPGQTYAPQTGFEQQQIGALGQAGDAFGQMAGLYGQVMPDAYGAALAAPDVANNPYYQGMAESIENQVNRNFSENLLPQITANQVAGGGFGTRGDVSEGIAARGTSEALADALAALSGSMYGQGLEASSAAMGMAPGVFGQLPGMFGQQAAAYGQAGALERGEAQRGITEAMQRHEFGEMEPWRRTAQLSNLALPIATAFGTDTGKAVGTATPSPFRAIADVGSLVAAGMGGIGGMGAMGGGGFGMPTTGGNYGGMSFSAPPMGGYGGYAPNPYQMGAPGYNYPQFNRY